MTAAMAAEALPLALIALRPHGLPKVMALLGFGASPIPAAAWLLAVAITLAYAAASVASLSFIRTHLFDATALKLLAFPFALITGTFEELFFRKWLMDIAAAHAVAIPLQIGVSAIAFGFVHGIWGLFGRNMQAAVKATLYTTALGAALAVDYVLASRHLAPAAWSHIAINLIIEPWLLLAVINLRPAQGLAPPPVAP